MHGITFWSLSGHLRSNHEIFKHPFSRPFVVVSNKYFFNIRWIISHLFNFKTISVNPEMLDISPINLSYFLDRSLKIQSIDDHYSLGVSKIRSSSRLLQC